MAVGAVLRSLRYPEAFQRLVGCDLIRVVDDHAQSGG
jgi:hypothetical protein